MADLDVQRVYGFYKGGLLDQIAYFPSLDGKTLPDEMTCAEICAKNAHERQVVQLDPAKLPELGSQLVA